MSSFSLYDRQDRRKSREPNSSTGILWRILQSIRLAAEVLGQAQDMRREASRTHLFLE